MAAEIVPGQRSWSMTRDEQGHREYKLVYLVRCAPTDGPATALQASGLPQPGDAWLVDGDSDPWAFCKQNATVTPLVTKEPNKHFEVEFTYSSKPDLRHCKDQQVDDPLLQPQKVSGGIIKYQEEATHDRFGAPINNSAHEMIHGPQVEFDTNRPYVRIEQNVPDLQLGLVSSMIDTVNDAPLWGLAARCIKLSSFSWEVKYYGACSKYYTRTFEFDVRYETFDRDVLDEGTKVLNGYWDDVSGDWTLIGTPDKDDPRDFIQAVDRQGNPMHIILNGEGRPAAADPEEGEPGSIHVEKYEQSNFLLLGVPTQF